MDLFGENVVMLICGCALFCAIFTIGVFLQIKIISTVKRDQTMAWEINLAHAVVMVVIFSSVLILKTMSYFQITFYGGFGKWPCYLLLSVMIFGFLEMLFHSLYISLYKYIFIVYREAVNRTGEQKTKPSQYRVRVGIVCFDPTCICHSISTNAAPNCNAG